MAHLILVLLLFSPLGFGLSPWLGLGLFGLGFALACGWVVALFLQMMFGPPPTGRPRR